MLGLEAFTIFLAWMLVLSVTWSDSARLTHERLSEWRKLRALETSVALSDALVLTHHTQPWKGCAIFDEALQRTRSYVVDKECLQNLLTPPPSPLVARVSLHQNLFDVNYFSRAVDENETCVSIRRPVLLFPTLNVAFLDVMSCV